MQFILTQCTVLGFALGAGDPPPLASYNFGVTGEPTEVDTAFGNLGELGPVYNVPEARNESSVTSGGNPQIGKSTTSEPSKIVQPTTIVATGTLNSSNLEELTTIKTTDGENFTLPGMLASKEESSTSTTVPIPTQRVESTTISKEQGTLITTVSANNVTSDLSNNNSTTPTATKDSNSSTPSTSIASSTSSSTPSPTTQKTPNGPQGQTFHSGSPNSTAPTIPPSTGHNETKHVQNSTNPSKPNSSMSLYSNNEKIWLAIAVASLFVMNIKHA